MEKSERSVYTPQDFLQWREGGTLDLTPKFQRRGVWSPAARSFFVDSLLRQMPVPPIYIRITQDEDTKRILRQVVDGQQRLAAVLDYIRGKYRLSKTLPAKWAGKSFDSLTPELQHQLVSYSFSTEVFHGISDLEVLETFARLNTYSVPLNAQELRNGRFFGLFKQSAYALAHEHLEFWRRHGIFTERNIARMNEVELVSELLITQIDGMQDKKKSIDEFYEDFDSSFPRAKTLSKRLRDTFDLISEVFETTLKMTEFHRPPLFYTLFCVVYHRTFGLPKIRFRTPRRPLTRKEGIALSSAVGKLSELVASARAGISPSRRHERFVNACLRQTDNIRPRELRFTFLWRDTFGG